MRTIITIFILILIAVVAPHAPRANPSAAQSVFATAYNTSTNGLVGWWKLESDTDSVAVDQMGNNDGTWEGGASSTDAAGFVGNGGDFDGDGDYVNVSHSDILQGVPLSISTWIYFNDFDSRSEFLTKRSDDDYGAWNIGQNDGHINFFVYDSSCEFASRTGLSTSTELVQGKWHHILATVTSTNITMYIDGKYENSEPHSDGMCTSRTDNMRIGVGCCSRYHNGSIDEVRIYNRALSAHEIRRLYLQGHSQSDEVNE